VDHERQLDLQWRLQYEHGGGITTSPPFQYTANAERFGTFVQMSYRFAPHP
jgi:hypothetical protein